MLRSFCLLAAFAAAALTAENDLLLLQKPALSRTQVVFVFAGDLWSVPREGGEAVRLTAGPGSETNPVFSPDGAWIAFTGEYDGNVDVYVVSASGGVPRRLTWHPAPDMALGWTPDSRRVLFSSTRTSYSRFAELFTVPLEGGFPEKLPLPMGYEGTYSPDGARLAYVPLPRAFTVWKRYRGGRTTPIWIADLATSRIEKIPRENSNDFNPMWVGDRIYFLSDRNGPVTLFSYDLRTRKVAQAVENRGLDLKSASAGEDAIVYEQFGSLHLYDLKSGRTRPLAVRVSGDFPELRPRWVNVSRRLRNAHISPSGARAVFEARGEILTVPAEKGDARNLTESPGVMERDPAWSPEGGRIAYFSDESGEYELHVRAQDGSGPAVKIPLGEPPAFYSSPRWSPDGKKIAYIDCHLGIWYLDLDSKKPVRVDRGIYWSGYREQVPVWSPDGKWLAYSKRLENYLGAIFLYSLEQGRTFQVTDGMSDARYPVFDKDGKYLYFTASTDSGPSLQPDLHSFARRVTRTVYLAVLSRDEPSPLRPESDEEKPAAETKEPSRKPGELPAVRIDVENLPHRILPLPLPPRLYSELQAGKPGVLFAVEAPLPAPGAEPSFTVHRFDLKSRKSDVVLTGVRFFEVSANGEKMLYRQQDRWYIAPRPTARERTADFCAAHAARTGHSSAHRESRSARGPAAGMAPDVPRSLAHRARVLLRSRLSRPRSESRRKEIRAVPGRTLPRAPT
jgi:tricorn protease